MFSKLRVVAIIVAVLIVIALIVPFLIPVNKFRPVIEEKATAAVGRKVQIADLRLSLLTGSISATDLSIADDPQFSQAPFLTAKSLKIGVEMMPLIFSRALNITSIAIVNPDVTILQIPQVNGITRPWAALLLTPGRPILRKPHRAQPSPLRWPLTKSISPMGASASDPRNCRSARFSITSILASAISRPHLSST